MGCCLHRVIVSLGFWLILVLRQLYDERSAGVQDVWQVSSLCSIEADQTFIGQSDHIVCGLWVLAADVFIDMYCIQKSRSASVSVLGVSATCESL